jgi:hypothetical protein
VADRRRGERPPTDIRTIVDEAVPVVVALQLGATYGQRAGDLSAGQAYRAGGGRQTVTTGAARSRSKSPLWR